MLSVVTLSVAASLSHPSFWVVEFVHDKTEMAITNADSDCQNDRFWIDLIKFTIL